MSNSKIWLSSPHMGGGEQKYIQEAFDTNWVAPVGTNVTAFEKDLESYLGSNSFVGVLSSGTAALHLGLILLGVKKGDEVICQSMTFSASANPIVYLDATPVFVDSEIDTWNICPNALETAIKDRIKKGKRPKAIIAVHLYGMPYKVNEIREIATKYEIPILEDSAEALGSKYKGQKCGTFGDISILSFNGNKVITTSVGGAIVTKSLVAKDRALFLGTQARENTIHYEHREIGYNYRMSNVCAGIGRGQIEVLDSHIEKRREMNKFYVSIFKKNPLIEVLTEPNGDYFSNHWLSVIKANSSLDYRLLESLQYELDLKNIESRPLWKPMHLQPVFKGASYYGGNICEQLFRNGLCLPSGSNLTDADRDRIKNVIATFFEYKIG